jgi:hypothetical protein
MPNLRQDFNGIPQTNVKHWSNKLPNHFCLMPKIRENKNKRWRHLFGKCWSTHFASICWQHVHGFPQKNAEQFKNMWKP